ncbi:MAG: peptidoglycan-binding protein, partial [Cyanobacteria bacterium REEB65]|nr:peptidoglycan-binding protein [Cyanobacteria bacterium REEB65]
KQYNLAPDAANVEAFVTEVSGYQNNSVGPDTGDSQSITALQNILIKLGYSSVQATGAWDDADASAVTDFKKKNGLHQTYKLADGTWAINEYVDVPTANAMVAALQAAAGSATTGH